MNPKPMKSPLDLARMACRGQAALALWPSLFGIAAVLLLGSFAASAGDPQREQARAVFGELPAEVPRKGDAANAARIDLGRQLYFDARLSKNHDVSCNTCHGLDQFGVDGDPTSTGHRGQKGGRNAPTVYNSALHITQFWDGRAADLEAQAQGPPLNPIEMAMPDAAAVEQVLKSIPGYAKPFAAAFPGEKDPISFVNMARAIGAFERKLMTPSPFDAYIAGDDAAISAEAKKGLQTFFETGCVACHNGPGFGGNSYQKLGAIVAYETEDGGRFEVTGVEVDRFFFKVPSLRNIAKTGPYFHDGSVKTLEEAIRLMAKHQLGRQLDEVKVAEIVAFLDSLTGTAEPAYIAKPTLPASGPDTPKPDPS
jgi:cytochrome c peroxidase